MLAGGMGARPGVCPGDWGEMLAIGAVSSSRQPAGTQALLVVSELMLPFPTTSLRTNHHPFALDITTNAAPTATSNSSCRSAMYG